MRSAYLETLHELADKDKRVYALISDNGVIVTVEDHNITGGFGSAVAEVIAEYGKGVKFRRLGLTGFSKGYGNHEEVKTANGVGRKQIREKILELK